MIPREELHTCHMVPRRKKSQQQLQEVQEETPKQQQQQQQQQRPVVPELPNYFNSLDENNRLQDAKERSDESSSVRQSEGGDLCWLDNLDFDLSIRYPWLFRRVSSLFVWWF